MGYHHPWRNCNTKAFPKTKYIHLSQSKWLTCVPDNAKILACRRTNRSQYGSGRSAAKLYEANFLEIRDWLERCSCWCIADIGELRVGSQRILLDESCAFHVSPRRHCLGLLGN